MKKNRIKRILLFFLLTFLILPVGAAEYKGVTQDDVDEAKEQMKKAEEELRKAKEQNEALAILLDELSNNISDTRNYIAEVDRYMAEIAGRIYELNVSIAEKEIDIADKENKIYNTRAAIGMFEELIAQTKEELAVARSKEASQYEAMKLRIQYMYENGDEKFISILFSSENMIDFLNNVEYISEISLYDREKLTEYENTRDEIIALIATQESQENELIIQEQILAASLEELNSQLAVLSSLKAEQEVQMSTYNAIYQAKNNELNNLIGQQANTEQLKQLAEAEIKEQEERAEQARIDYENWVEALAKQQQDAEAEATRKLAEIGLNGLTWPLPGYNNVTSKFGMRRHPIFGYEKLHDGIDISGPDVNCKPIVAAYSGTVSLSQTYWGYGECIKIDHGGGIQTLYAHASVRLVSVGQYVNAGDTIALVGSTGNSTGPHLHFSFIIKGKFVDPLEYLVVPVK